MILPLLLHDFVTIAYQRRIRIASPKHHMSRKTGQLLHSAAKVSVSRRATVVIATVAWRGDGNTLTSQVDRGSRLVSLVFTSPRANNLHIDRLEVATRDMLGCAGLVTKLGRQPGGDLPAQAAMADGQRTIKARKAEV